MELFICHNRGVWTDGKPMEMDSYNETLAIHLVRHKMIQFEHNCATCRYDIG